MINMPIEEYKKWIRFRDKNIYDYLNTIYDDVDSGFSREYQEELEFIDSIWTNVLQINNNINKFQPDINYLLYSHLLIINSEYLSTTIYKDYDIESALNTIGYISTSVSDSSTSVGYTPSIAITNQSLNDGVYYVTKFGREYLSLIEQLQSFIVVL